MSSLNEITTDLRGGLRGAHFQSQQTSGQIFKHDGNGFFSTPDICFTQETLFWIFLVGFVISVQISLQHKRFFADSSCDTVPFLYPTLKL
jgi:hypothetical protein